MPSITFSLVQTALFWENKERNLAMLEEKIMGIAQPTQVVVLPEMFSTGFSMKPDTLAETMEDETMQWMRRVAARKRVILVGSFICSESTANSTSAYYNRLVWMQPNGQYGYYNKRHLFAYAGEDRHYTAGTERLVASVNGWRINLQVCYDLRFPVWARNRVETMGEVEPLPEYDILLYVANWPQRRSHAWKTLLQARAIENQCYVVGVNRVGEDGNSIYYSGDSMVIEPLGEVLYHKQDEEDIFTITLRKEQLEEVRGHLPFLKDGDKFQLLT